MGDGWREGRWAMTIQVDGSNEWKCVSRWMSGQAGGW